MRSFYANFDLQFIAFLRRYQAWIARGAIFIVYFWFGFLKLIDESPASPLAEALFDKTVGGTHFDTLYVTLALLECLIGILFLFPKAIRFVFPLIIIHLVIVCSPLLLVPGLSWSAPLVPTLEGQYIIKNVLIAALAVVVASTTRPVAKKKR